MSVLWAVPPVAASIAMIIVLLQLRAIGDATSDLAVQLQRLDEVRASVAEVRSAASERRAMSRGIRLR